MDRDGPFRDGVHNIRFESAGCVPWNAGLVTRGGPGKRGTKSTRAGETGDARARSARAACNRKLLLDLKSTPLPAMSLFQAGT